MIQPLGRFTTVAGTPVSVVQAIPTAQQPFHVHAILVQALQGNTGRVYVGSSAMNVATEANLYAILPAPSAGSIPSFSAALGISRNGLDAGDFWIDVEVSGEGAIVTVLVN
jgi:hypothetical protein